MTTEPLNKVSKRFETPILDSLKEQQRNFVLAYCQCFDQELAAKEAGYKNRNATARKAQIRSLLHNPKIVEAIDEYLARRLEQLDAGRAALCTRLMSQAMATIHDVCDRVQHRNGTTNTIIEGKFSFVPKDIADIEPRFAPAASLITRNPDGSYGWDNMSQHRAATLLAKLMMWDQSILEQSAPIIFNFGNIQENEYAKPEDDGADMSTFNKPDEIEKLTH
jgi:hypothetical protein